MTDKPKASISHLIFSGGNNFHINENEKIILVGPNNSGKSLTLREIISICANRNSNRTLAIKDVSINKKGTIQAFRAFLDNETEYASHSFRYRNWNLRESHVSAWEAEGLPGSLIDGFIKNITADNRLSVCNQQKSISPNEPKTVPQQVLYDDELLMEKVSGLFRLAFGKDLMFDFRGGDKLPIHVGDLPVVEGDRDRVGDDYVKQVRLNPLLDEQGDGMKSYAGILFETIVSDLDITLIDEPEAFLHPPQMRKLGESLASNVKGQLFIATHSSDILKGLLEGTQGGLRILRLSRENDLNKVCEASAETIKSLWEKPDFKYSNALESIFHEQAIICEDDSDCRLVNSVEDYLSAKSQLKPLDTVYIPTGGKHGVPKIATVLRDIGVPVKTILDIDFLSEQNLVEKTVNAFGGNWDEIRPLWLRVDAAVRNGEKAQTIPEIKENIINILNSCESTDLPKRDINDALKQNSEWNVVKKFGEQGVPNGQAQQDYRTLRDKLQNIGIYLVPVGEIENFCPDIGSHGPKFVMKLLSETSLDDQKLSALREFVINVHNGAHSILPKNQIADELRL